MCVQNPLPMKPSTIAEYFQYCCEPAGTQLLEYGNDICSKEDDNKVPIYCTGRWRAPGNLAKCKTAIETIHEKYDLLDGRYKDACKRCIAINMDKTHNFTGCRDHTNGALLRPKGNAMKSPIATEAYDCYFQKLSSEWEVTGNVQLLPDEIRKLQQHLCSDNDIRNLQVYTMTLISIKCFLRADEVISIKLDHFDKDFCMVNNGYRVESLCLKVRGKSERERNPVYLLLYRDDEFPEMCPVRHLLVYMAFMGHSSGYLFPNKKETEMLRRLQTSSNGNTWKSSDRQAYTHWSYSSWLNKLRTLVTENLGHKPMPNTTGNCSKVGTHTLRKTAYLFACWGSLRNINVPANQVADDSTRVYCCSKERERDHLHVDKNIYLWTVTITL
jgi:integrase